MCVSRNSVRLLLYIQQKLFVILFINFIHRVGPECGCSTAISVIGNVGCIPRGSNDTDVCSNRGDCVCDMCQCHPIPLLEGRIYQVNFLKYLYILIIINKLLYFRVIIVSVIHLLVQMVHMKMVV